MDTNMICTKCGGGLIYDYSIRQHPFCPRCEQKSHKEEELVVHPKHYNSHPSGIECIKIAQHYNFNIGSALKYIWRQGLKQSEPSIRDLEKAIQYITFEIERIKEHEK